MHRYRLHRLGIHVDVPYAKTEVISGEDVATVFAELDVRHGRDDFGKERLVRWVFFFLVHCHKASTIVI